MNSLENQICVNFLRGLCENQHCPSFHPIKLKKCYAHWSLGLEDQGFSFSITANSIGFDKSNKKKIRNEFFLLLKNLAIYQERVLELRLVLYDIDYPHYEDPMYEEENYERMFSSLYVFKYLTNLEINIGSLFPLLQCKKAFERMFNYLYSLKKLTIEMQNNKDDRIKSEYDYNDLLDILVNQRQLSSIYLRIDKPSKKDYLLMNLLQESFAEEVTLEIKNVVSVKITNNFKRAYFRQIWFTVLDEGYMNMDPEKIIEELRRILTKISSSFTSFKCVDENISELPLNIKNKNIMGQFHSNWLTYFNFEKMQLDEITLRFSEGFLKSSRNFENLLQNKLMKLKNLRKIRMETLFYEVGEEGIKNLVKFMRNNSDSLISLTILEIAFGVRWPELKELFDVLLKMNRLVNLELFLLDRKVVMRANVSVFFEIFRKFLMKTPYLVNFSLKAEFGDHMIESLVQDYSFFIMKKKLLVMMMMVLKRKDRYRNYRKEIFMDIFLKYIHKIKPLKESLPYIMFKSLSRLLPRNLPIQYNMGMGMDIEEEEEV